MDFETYGFGLSRWAGRGGERLLKMDGQKKQEIIVSKVYEHGSVNG